MSAARPLPAKHSTASVIILTTLAPLKTLLIHHRKYDKWMPPGGHVEDTENPVEAAIRETKEETGLDISWAIGAPIPLDSTARHIRRPDYFLEEDIPVHGKQPAHVHLDLIYVVRIPEQAPKHNKAESHDIGWFTLEETEKLTTFENIHMLLRQELAV
jgi:8-oxo-dGTP pyrophosphatase MutT (NUDIX family)